MELDEVIKQPILFKFGSNDDQPRISMSNDINSFDSGFDSLLNLSLNDDSCEYSPAKSPRFTFEQKSPLMTIRTPPKQHSSPASPIKQQQQHVFLPPTPSKATGMVITPIKRVNHVADVNGIYLSCIKSPLKSPTNYYNTDTYIRERDSHTANLLRSPAFKIQYGGLETTPVKKIKCRKFSSATEEAAEEEEEKPKTTPTEDEFLQLLFKNRHIAANSELIIGRCMGLEHFDIITELNKRSMNNVLDIILNNLNASDYKNIYHVNKSWREVIQQDKKRNKERVKYIKFKRKFIESAKENISSPGFIQETLKLKRKFSVLSSTTTAFNKLDINCLNNTTTTTTASDFNTSVLSACSTKSNNSSVCYFDFDNTASSFENSINVDEKMVMTDLINQHNRKLSSFLTPSPSSSSSSVPVQLLNKQLSLDEECLDMNFNKKSAKASLANSTKICSKTSRRNLKRL